MLSPHEQLRYSRQIMLDKIGDEGQTQLKNASVLIVGIGGLGNPVATYLSAAGIGKLFLADGDKIEVSNLQRQVMFKEDDIGKNKADCLSELINLQNSDVDVEVVDEMLDEELAEYYLPLVDVVIDCTDNIQTRYLLNKVCLSYKTPLVIGAATGFDGQQMIHTLCLGEQVAGVVAVGRNGQWHPFRYANACGFQGVYFGWIVGDQSH